MTKSIHWGEIKIDSVLSITGRGEVAVVDFNTDLYKQPPFKIGDTFQYDNQRCQITGVECSRGISDYFKSPVGLKFKRIE